jgi:hypothetical protein
LIRRTHRLYPFLALALALLIAQAGALVHATSHLKQDAGGLHSQLCGQCLSYSTMFAMAGGAGTAPPLPVLAKTLLASAAIVSLIDRSVPRAFRSRAPPRPR